MIKVIAGKYRGRNLFVPDSLLVPSKSIVREAIGNMAQSALEGAICLDLFAGSGSLGIEFLSRGAASCDFVDRSSDCVQAIKKNLATLQERNGRVYPCDSIAFLKEADTAYDIIFIDPPYKELGLYEEALAIIDGRGLLKKDGFIIMEFEEAFPLPDGFSYSKVYRYGKTKLIKAKKKTAEAVS